jgi:hypothetical protein
MHEDITARCNAIEECYEYMLAYAGQGLGGGEGSQSSGIVRDYLQRAANALSGLSTAYAAAIEQQNLQPAESYRAFLAVIETDSRNALAAIQMVLAQAALSSQMIDNLNASIHLRALLTDLFLIDEILRPRQAEARSTTTS